MTMRRCILVPFDFIDPSKRACDVALELATALGARLLLVHVVEPFPVALTPAELASIETGTVERLERAASLLRPQLAGGVETVVVAGTPWQEIDRLAEEVRADLVVMGTHGRHGVVRALMGSVAAHVVRTSTIPVTTVGSHVATSRNDAGLRLAARTAELGLTAPLVLALSRGALTIATALAHAAKGSVDLWGVERVTTAECGVIGAVGEDERPVLDACCATRSDGEREEAVRSALERLRAELGALRPGRPVARCAGRDVVLVADGLFCAAYARVAVDAMKQQGASRVVVASPVVDRRVFLELADRVAGIVALERATIADACLYRDDVLPSDLVAQQLLAAT
jgi:nucleotide-binding universal stress UspA family protein/predicted phosphoribosyltransferase